MNVFISYSRKDYEWVKKIRAYLQPLVNAKETIVLSDMDILPGQDWDEPIKKFIEFADIAIVLISPSYVASNFLCEFELSYIIKAAQENKIKVIPIMIQPVLRDGQIWNYQFLNEPSQPLALLSKNHQDIYLKKLLQLLKKLDNKTDTKINKSINIKKSFAPYSIDYPIEDIDYNIFYGNEENIFIQAERELERNKE